MAIHIVDVHSHSDDSVSRRKHLALQTYRDARLSPYGVPRSVTMKAGGEFGSGERNEGMLRLEITPHYKRLGVDAAVNAGPRSSIRVVFENGRLADPH